MAVGFNLTMLALYELEPAMMMFWLASSCIATTLLSELAGRKKELSTTGSMRSVEEKT